MIRKLTPKDYKKSEWSGGTTTQIAISPPEAKYADRDFLWRVSSATVELEESDFTPLPDYDRLIATLRGEILLAHNGGASIRLRPFEVHAFSGADATHSGGRCTDFNLMLRRGKASASMEALRLTEAEAPVCFCAEGSAACPSSFPKETILFYCAEGTANVGAAAGRPPEEKAPAGTSAACPLPCTLAPGDSLLVTEPVSLALSGPAVLMLCRMRTNP